MKIFLAAIVTLLLVSCSSDSKRHNSSSSSEKENKNAEALVVDTLTKSFPIQLGNDKGQLKIIEEKEFELQKFKDNRFIVSLEGFPGISFSKDIDMRTILEFAKEDLKGPVTFDYLEEAIIVEIDFTGVRSNTLMFNARLINSKQGKEILGRFSLFYRTGKKGKVYGWFVDEVRSIILHSIPKITI